jgi:putative SOS response-associated peptidase YedK
MCGRFVLYSSRGTLAESFDLAEVPELTLYYNITPSQPVGAQL